MVIKAGQIIVMSEQGKEPPAAEQAESTKEIEQSRPGKVRNKRTVVADSDGLIRRLPKGSPYLLDMLTSDES